MRWLCQWFVLQGLLSLTLQAGTLAQFRSVLGEIDVELLDVDKPATVQNFIRYVDTGAYSNMFFHRWVPHFVIQGGGFLVTNRHQTNADFAIVPTFGTITNEYLVGRQFSNTYGTLAMARQSGNTNSATSQWYFNLKDNPSLDSVDGGFTVFGKVVGGTNVLDRFNITTTNNGIWILTLQAPLSDVPVLATHVTFEDLIYVDITLMHVAVRPALGSSEISWSSVSNRVNRVEVTTEMPPVWKELFRTNGTGDTMRFLDMNPSTNRFYRVVTEYADPG